jgi:hypothetical protein
MMIAARLGSFLSYPRKRVPLIMHLFIARGTRFHGYDMEKQ